MDVHHDSPLELDPLRLLDRLTRSQNEQSLFDELAPWSAGPTVPTLLGPDESLERAFDPPTMDSLRRLKASVDPSYVIRGNYPVHGH